MVTKKSLAVIGILVLLFAAVAVALYLPKDPSAESEDQLPVNPDASGAAGTMPAKSYIGNSPEECSTMRFMCVEGMQPFEDENGCGCEPVNNWSDTPESSEGITLPVENGSLVHDVK